MAGRTLSQPWSLRVPLPLYERLHAHLFPGDGDEHGAVLAAGICETARGVRLLVREVFLAEDGVDYVPGTRGYRALTPRFVAERAGYCAEQQLAYLAVHNHGGRGSVAFSGDDLASHARGYPALLDITHGGPVGALVFAEDAVAGDVWLPGGARQEVDHALIIGPTLRSFYPVPPTWAPAVDPVYDRHAQMFGDLGQQRLRQLKVGVIGAGGGGSLLIQMLARLGVGHIIAIDFDRVDLTNLPRIVGATRWDALAILTARRSQVLQRLGKRYARHKVRVAERVARQAHPGVCFEEIVGDVRDAATAARLVDADVLFLASDTLQSRLIFNNLIHQYLIPGYQIGAKVLVEQPTHQVDDISSVARPVLPYPGGGCLLCNRLIPPGRLQLEALSPEERVAQRYVNDPDVAEPSVITLNAVGAALAANDMLLMVTGLLADHSALRHLHYDARTRELWRAHLLCDAACLDCGNGVRSRLGRGDRMPPPGRRATMSTG